MAVSIRQAKPDDMEELLTMDFRNFGADVLPADANLPEGLLNPERFVVAFDDGQMVGAGGSFDVALTLPGNGSLPMSAVTWVSVMASHRRQGILRSLMVGLDELAVDFGDPLLGLTASEGPIYERFGYGVATRRRVIEIDRRRTQIRAELSPERVKLVDAETEVDALLAIYDRYWPTQVGEISRTEPMWREQNVRPKKPNFAAVHKDGYAVWSVSPEWHDGHPAHQLFIRDLVAVTPEAHLALWNLILTSDLVGPIRSYGAVGLDDRLPYLLTDPRALRTTDLNDGLWLKVADPVRSFAARTYRSDDRLVIGITEDRRVTADAPIGQLMAIAGDEVTETEDSPDIVVTRAGLGPLLLGSSASTLAAGAMVSGTQDLLERADVLFGTGGLAHSGTDF